MANYGLDLQQKKKSKKHRTTVFIICFICFIIVLGSVSTLLWWRSLNYDFNNIFKNTDETETTEAPTTAAENVVYEGSYVFMTAVTSDDAQQTMFVELISVDLGTKTIRVVPVDKTFTDTASGKTCEQLIAQKNYNGVVDAINSKLHTEICRYAVFTESGLKSVFRSFGDLTVKIPQNIEHDTPDMFLELQKGENTLTADQVSKYLKYAYETQSPAKAAETAATVITAAFSCYYNAENNAYAQSYFEDICNICNERGGRTNISIVDFANAADEAEYLVPRGTKEKLKVFVSANLTSEEQ